MREAYIVKGFRTAVGKAPKGFFKFKRPDELAAETIEFLINSVPDFDKYWIDDLIVGNAVPEAEQGFNVARLISLMGLKIEDVPGVTINRPPRDGHMAFVRSPDGISIEILQEGESLPQQEPWKSMENSGSW